MQILKAGVFYFAVVFGAGLILGPIRILWVVPRLGLRVAELAEEPIMLMIIILAARWVARRFSVSSKVSNLLSIGGMALGLMLVAEFTFVAWLRGLSVRDYLAGRDPVSGTVYCAMLGVFGMMPLLVRRKCSPGPGVEELS